MKFNKTKIERCNSTWNPVTGCYHNCEFCYLLGRKTCAGNSHGRSTDGDFLPLKSVRYDLGGGQIELFYTITGRPVTKKNSMRIGLNQKTGHPFILQSQQYQRYEREAVAQLKPHRPQEPIKTPVSVACVYYMPTRRRVDLTNLIAATHDILVKAGILLDDSCDIIYSVDGSRVRHDKENPRVEITVRTGE